MKLPTSSSNPKPNNIIKALLSKIRITLFPLNKYKIIGNSMHPTLHNGDEILINKLAYLIKQPQIGDIIALKSPEDNRILIKRITKIINNKYFVTGDNEKASTDSRKFGMLEKEKIIGKVIFKIHS